MQDTIKPKIIVRQDAIKHLPDSVVLQKKDFSNTPHIAGPIPVRKTFDQPIKTDTITIDATAVCTRNSIADFTFYDSTNFISRIEVPVVNSFPLLFTEKNMQRQQEDRAILVKHLKEGQDLPVRQFNNDWTIGILLIAAFLYSVIRTASKSMLPYLTRFFLFRGINDPGSRDIGALFHWQSTISNLISFLVLGLFGYFAAAWYSFIPTGISGLLFWIICVGIIVLTITLRHFICFIIGNVSDETEAFNEYLLTIYQSYRVSALIIFVFIILMSYTVFLPVRVYFIAGSAFLLLMYLIRIIRLFLIFINRSVSIFYLILYLCALEILPVLISLKYITGLI